MNIIIRNIPNTLTLANLVCGLFAIIFSFQLDFSSATICIFIGLSLDFLDGFIARLLNIKSDLGKQLDSMSDLVTFGLAPGFMMFHFMYYLENNTAFKFSMENAVMTPSLIAIIIPICSALRLAKFNSSNNQEKSFLGVPTPAIAVFFASIPHIDFNSFPMFSDTLFISIIIIIMSFLLVSNISVFAFKFNSDEKISSQINILRIILILSSIILLFIFRFAGFPFIVILYIILSVINNIF